MHGQPADSIGGVLFRTVLEPPADWPHQRGKRPVAGERRTTLVQKTREEYRRASADGVCDPSDRHSRDMVNLRSVRRGIQAPGIRRSCKRSGRIEPPASLGLPPRCALSAIYATGRARKEATSTGTPPSLLSSVPRTQKGPLAGALVSFSLIRPEPDTVIGTTRRFQPWRELPSWLRAGGSVR